MIEHQKLVLECEVSRPDKPAQWFKDDVPVTASARIRLTSEGGVHRLIIDCVELDDEAVYKVVIGGNESTAEVLVEGEDYEVKNYFCNYNCLVIIHVTLLVLLCQITHFF